MASSAPWTPFGEYDPSQRENPNPFLPVEDIALVFDPFPQDVPATSDSSAVAAPPQVSSSSSASSTLTTTATSAPPVSVLPKPISEWQSAEFITPVAAQHWGNTPPCISGVAKQTGEAPGKRWMNKRLCKRALKAHREYKPTVATMTKTTDPFQRLSDDLLCRVLLNMDVTEILRFSLLNRQWARVGGSGYLWRTLYLRNLNNQLPYGIRHFSFDRTQVWLEEPAPKYWRRIYFSKVRDLANALRKKSGGWKVFNKPEVFVDVIEKLHVHVAVSGRVLHAEIKGSVIAECHLSDYASLCELKLNLTDSKDFPRVVFDDVTLHNAVEVSSFAATSDPRVRFRAPSAGPFEVLRYRVSPNKQRVPFTVEAMYMKDLDKHAYEVHVTVKCNFKESKTLTDVVVNVPVPPASYVKTQTKVTGGEAEYHPRTNVIVWRIPVLSNKPVTLTSTVQIPRGEALDWSRPPLELECAPFLYNVSGLRCLGFVLLDSKETKAANWVRYTTAVASFKHDV